MKNIKPECGWGNEAIEIGLWHANNENENQAISQIILIGDMPANTESEIKINRESIYGEKYWSECRNRGIVIKCRLNSITICVVT